MNEKYESEISGSYWCSKWTCPKHLVHPYLHQIILDLKSKRNHEEIRIIFNHRDIKQVIVAQTTRKAVPMHNKVIFSIKCLGISDVIGLYKNIEVTGTASKFNADEPVANSVKGTIKTPARWSETMKQMRTVSYS